MIYYLFSSLFIIQFTFSNPCDDMPENLGTFSNPCDDVPENLGTFSNPCDDVPEKSGAFSNPCDDICDDVPENQAHFLTLVMTCLKNQAHFLTLVMTCLKNQAHFLTLVMVLHPPSRIVPAIIMPNYRLLTSWHIRMDISRIVSSGLSIDIIDSL